MAKRGSIYLPVACVFCGVLYELAPVSSSIPKLCQASGRDSRVLNLHLNTKSLTSTGKRRKCTVLFQHKQTVGRLVLIANRQFEEFFFTAFPLAIGNPQGPFLSDWISAVGYLENRGSYSTASDTVCVGNVNHHCTTRAIAIV